MPTAWSLSNAVLPFRRHGMETQVRASSSSRGTHRGRRGGRGRGGRARRGSGYQGKGVPFTPVAPGYTYFKHSFIQDPWAHLNPTNKPNKDENGGTASKPKPNNENPLTSNEDLELQNKIELKDQDKRLAANMNDSTINPDEAHTHNELKSENESKSANNDSSLSDNNEILLNK